VALRVLADRLAVCRLPATAPWPGPASAAGFWSVTRTDAELSVVCPEDAVPGGGAVRVEQGWRALEVAGPLDFSMVGVMAGLAVPLAEAGVSVFVVSTYDTDYVLVRSTAITQAIAALHEAGHTVHGD
jgi:hypothetical protein